MTAAAFHSTPADLTAKVFPRKGTFQSAQGQGKDFSAQHEAVLYQPHITPAALSLLVFQPHLLQREAFVPI